MMTPEERAEKRPLLRPEVREGLLLHFNRVLCFGKIVIAIGVAFCSGYGKAGYYEFFYYGSFWIFVGLSLLVDPILLKHGPSYDFELTPTEVERYKLTTEEMRRYFEVSPKIRLMRAGIALGIGTCLGWLLSDLHVGMLSFFIAYIVGPITWDLLLRQWYGVRAPTYFRSVELRYSPGAGPLLRPEGAGYRRCSLDSEASDPLRVGSTAWMHAQSSTTPGSTLWYARQSLQRTCDRPIQTIDTPSISKTSSIP